LAFSPLRFVAEQQIPLPLEQVWELLSNTDHLNRTLGLPPVSYGAPVDTKEGFYREASAQIFKIFSLSWKEYPFEWIRNERYTVLRLFEGGPLERFFGGVELSREGPGTRVRVFADLTPRNLLGRLIAPLAGQKGVRNTLNYCAKFLELVGSRAEDPLPRPRQRNRTSQKLLDDLLAKLEGLPIQAALIPRLRHRLLEGTDAEVLRMRPFALAELWKADPHEVLRLFLYATKLGLLNLSWEFMCPNCRVAKAEYLTLVQASSRFHCDTCGADYEANLDQYVELRFSVHPAVREAESTVYCIAGPANTPHIIAQQYLPPGAERELSLSLGGEGLRLRALRYNQIASLNRTPDHLRAGDDVPLLHLTYTEGGWEPAPLSYRPGLHRIRLWNRSSKALVAVLEKVRWDPYAVTAAQVTALQEFRDLFSSEVLAPGQQIGIENLSILFTDLKGSTSLYESVGEAPAFRRVRMHFEFLTERIKKNQGALVKTIGDAVMAVFPLPERAVRTALEVQSQIAGFNRSLSVEPPLILKVGVHHGPAIAVNANNYLDYFGRTVNIAARIQRESLGGDVVLTEELFQNPAVQQVLKDFKFEPAIFRTHLKGIEGEFTLYRLSLELPPRS